MKQAVFPIVVLLALSGCASKELTRLKAKTIIESLDVYQLKTQQVSVSGNEVQELLKQGYVTWAGFPRINLAVTQKGKQYFDSASGQMGTFSVESGKYIIVPTIPMKPEIIEITGITGGGDTTVKQVEYRWHWLSSSQPKELREMLPSLTAVNGQTLTMKLYDDGWRVAQ